MNKEIKEMIVRLRNMILDDTCKTETLVDWTESIMSKIAQEEAKQQ